MIIDLQRRIAEAGRIRIGQQVPAGRGKRPTKLDTFRLTSPNKTRITQAAELYGGTPKEWDAPAGKQWEVVTDTSSLNVIVPPSDMSFSQHYELWSAGGCQRRCDGVTESIADQPCVCDPDKRECSIHTRLSLMIRDLPGLGVWRLDTSGYYAAVELQGAVEVVRMAAGSGHMLPAQLRLEQRMVKRGGQTRRFAVPVLDIEVSPAQLLGDQPGRTVMVEQGTGRVLDEPEPRELSNGHRALTPVPDSVPERPKASIAEQASTVREKRRTRSSPPPIPPTGLPAGPDIPQSDADEVPATEPDPPLVGEQPELITPAQLKKLSILLKEAGFDDRETRHAFVIAAIGHDIGSAKELTKDEASKVIDTLEAGQQHGN